MRHAARVGYARCSRHPQDASSERDVLASRGCHPVYVDDEGLTRPGRSRPALDRALACCQAGDTLVVTAFERLVESLADAVAILERLRDRQITLEVGCTPYGWSDSTAQTLMEHLAVAAQFERQLRRLRTREGLAAARAKGNLRGRSALSPDDDLRVRRMRDRGDSISRIAHIFQVSTATIRRSLNRPTAAEPRHVPGTSPSP